MAQIIEISDVSSEDDYEYFAVESGEDVPENSQELDFHQIPRGRPIRRMAEPYFVGSGEDDDAVLPTGEVPDVESVTPARSPSPEACPALRRCEEVYWGERSHGAVQELQRLIGVLPEDRDERAGDVPSGSWKSGLVPRPPKRFRVSCKADHRRTQSGGRSERVPGGVREDMEGTTGAQASAVSIGEQDEEGVPIVR